MWAPKESIGFRVGDETDDALVTIRVATRRHSARQRKICRTAHILPFFRRSSVRPNTLRVFRIRVNDSRITSLIPVARLPAISLDGHANNLISSGFLCASIGPAMTSPIA